MNNKEQIRKNNKRPRNFNNDINEYIVKNEKKRKIINDYDYVTNENETKRRRYNKIKVEIGYNIPYTVNYIETCTRKPYFLA